MPRFTGVDHVAFSVTDVEASERFWTEVMGLLTVIDIGHGRVLMDTRTGFTVAVLQHPEGAGGPFSELTTGLDHIGFEVGSREELVEWQERLDAAGVEYTPIREMPLAYHLNFRGPDGLALELSASTEVVRRRARRPAVAGGGRRRGARHRRADAGPRGGGPSRS